ncbi:MAG: hypothetical protein QM715_13750 [Nibricoccus sp.]
MRFFFAILSICYYTNSLSASVSSYEVIPKTTDAEIGSAFNSPHVIYVDPTIVVENATKAANDRHELLVFLSGTDGTAEGAKAFCELAAELGDHVINLAYPNDIAASICAGDPNPKAFEEFRMAVIAGGQTKHITIAKADCIENRLAKLLIHLRDKKPKENWGQFLNSDNTVKWSAIAVSGQSQGGGHAALIGIKHRVARVICTGAPKDYSKKHDAPAAWYSLESATPKGCFFAFNHTQDPKACTPAQLIANLRALGLTGPLVDVASAKPPFQNSHILMTTFPAVTIDGPNGKGTKQAHNAAISSANASRWEKVWTYMLTEKTP